MTRMERFSHMHGRTQRVMSSATSQVIVRLPLGTHPFELTVVDDKGAATKAMVTVRIQ